MSIKSIILDFTGWTTAHGVPHVGSSSSHALKVFWAIVVVGSVSTFVYLLSNIIAKYFAYPVAVGISIKFEDLFFPAVTFCNLNPIKASLINNVTTIKNDSLFTQMLGNFSLAMKGQAALTNPIWHFQGVTDAMMLEQQAELNIAYILASMPASQAQVIGYSLTDLVVTCQYDQINCNTTTDFLQTSSNFYDNCYIFNYQNPPTYTSTRAGPAYGLALLLNLNQSEYILQSGAAGGRALVHTQTQYPAVESFGIALATGFATAVSVTFVTNERLGQPYYNCTTGSDFTDLYASGQYTYSVETCRRSCYNLAVSAQCGCCDPRYFCPAGTPYCTYNNITQTTCVINFNGPTSSFSSVYSCKCPAPCSDTTYTVTASTALWPAQSYIPDQCKNMSYNPPSWVDQTSCQWWYGNNTAYLQVYYEQMNFQDYAAAPAYPILSMLNEVGGDMAMFAGMSLVTATEYLSLLVMIFLYCLMKNRLQEKARKQQEAANARKAKIMAAQQAKAAAPPAKPK